MRPLSRLITFAAVVGAVSLSGSALAGLQDDGIVLRLGDRVTVDGEPLGCQVDRRGDQVVLDCRRAGRLAGTYGVFMGARTVRVARYRSSEEAKVVFTARHRGSSRTCRDPR